MSATLKVSGDEGGNFARFQYGACGAPCLLQLRPHEAVHPSGRQAGETLAIADVITMGNMNEKVADFLRRAQGVPDLAHPGHIGSGEVEWWFDK